ncbi:MULTISPECIES: peptidase domain-containing ABC transporter [Rhizobium]|jgi:ATP-binding cassette subfamily B protein|uniref:ATP-binding cassette subfamily B protein n=10 Tax=Rhizobium TaxID=379 RepID=A0A1C3YD11_9HYPH|nr:MULTISPECIES: peptidase domain-containing ABC transporter [Rhizobium]ACE94068.1 probable bacteriocin/lantibiotic ABC transporter, ATP-binding protein [Rhizobium etli CIAT 652]EGE57613.1 bacteriocin/lantibiotic ABC transporter, ATP-binding protein [Rhizobium etli CNPAF512]KEC70894.1 lactococcin-G-processing and transport ATP-binding protein LagD [Rhizobium leguminosarum bv. phaseoli CCGM1]UWU38804.1 peptidase domain-containing ABC transporter [Rhizobium leguminosarum bv. phaseoli]AAM55061.1 
MSSKAIKFKQRDITDCGAASLASVAAFYGYKLPLARIRQYASTDRSGTSVLGLTEAAQKLGFIAKGVKGGFDSLYKIPKPAIAHVVKEDLHHFVVVHAIDAKWVIVMDPALGEICKVPHQEFMEQWTGVLVLLVPADTFNRRDETTSPLARFARLLAPHRTVMAQALVGALVTTVLSLSTAIYVQKIVDHVIPAGNRNLLNLMSIAMLLILAIQILINLLRGRLVLQTGQKIDVCLILGYYNHILALPQKFFDSMRMGEIVSRMNDAVKIRSFLNDVSINMFVDILMILFSFGMMFIYSWNIALIVALAIPMYILVYWAINRMNRNLQRVIMENDAKLEAQLVESLGAVSTIKTSGVESFANFKMETRFVKMLHSVYSSGLISICGDNASTLLSVLFTIVLMWFGTTLALEQAVTPGELLSCYTLLGYITRPVARLIQTNRIVQDAFIAADRLFEIFELESASSSGIDATKTDLGDIRLENVTFRYGAQAEVFSDLSVSFRQGELTAVVGESGSGKSTLAALLQNVYQLEDGCIRIGQYALQDFSSASLHKVMAAVPQSIDVFSGSVIENIALGEFEPEFDKIVRICDRIGLRECIERWPGRFQAHLGENGVRLSGGEKQRLALARALYRDPDVLILDEATSSLDSAAEEFVLRVVEDLSRAGKTIIVITHRLSTVRGADNIVVLDKGRVIEEGKHADLVRTDGPYARLWRAPRS